MKQLSYHPNSKETVIMKVLIVDDEELTRTGLVSSIDWESLGIHTVLQADDGINGLETARIHKPEIILCDVRMPRMDGIAMLEQLETILPDTIPIFMSGYSDKEYLKAAIKLRAIRYIEKPLNPEEIREAVGEARELYLHKQRMHRSEALHSMETSSRLALQLTVPYGANARVIDKLAEELSISLTSSTYFTAVIVQLAAPLDSTDQEESYHALNSFLEHSHMHGFYAEKKSQYLVYYLFGAARPSEGFLKKLESFFCQSFSHCQKYHIAAGNTVCGVSKAYQSYESAVILLQSSFFYPSGTFLRQQDPERSEVSFSGQLPLSPEQDFLEELTAQRENSCDALLDSLYSTYACSRRFLPNQVKELYYKLFSAVEKAEKQLKISGNQQTAGIVDSLEKCFTFQELHEDLRLKTRKFFDAARNSVQENSTIYLIKDYISKNYANETLSVKDISSHVFLSASYVCTFFKNETGQTLNQYLTEYRMEKAKQLLADPRYKISDISSKVGYNDGNYFGKSFKKYTGFSPSEYREKNQ